MKKLLFAISILVSYIGTAQPLVEASTSFTQKFDSYLTLATGDEYVGLVGDIDKKAGTMKNISFKVKDAKKLKLKTEEIKSFYFAAYDMVKGNFEPVVVDPSEPWAGTDLNLDLINQGYAYYENITIKTKNKTKPLLTQLLNPAYNSKVSVYYDPWNGAAIDPTADMALSYYVMKEGDDAAMELNRRKYEEQFPVFWAGCDAVLQMGAEWSKFPQHVTTYTTECN